MPGAAPPPADTMDSNGAFDRAGGARSTSPAPAPPPRPTPSPGRPGSLMDAAPAPAGAASPTAQAHVVRVVVCRDDRGYGMKVSGDNPVYVQSVKEGGAAERAGLHAGDKIIKVNGTNVTQSTHTEVVSLIRSSSQVVLTVQQRSPTLRPMTPNMHNRPATTPTAARITGPQPVDHEKQHQLHQEREQYYRLMIEQEQTHLRVLREQLTLDPDDERKATDLVKTERNLLTLQAMLSRSRNEAPNPTHQRTKSSPETLSTLTTTDGGGRKLSESLNDLSKEWEGAETPPGTPPPPYPSSPGAQRREAGRDQGPAEEGDDRPADEHFADGTTSDGSPFGVTARILANSSPIHAANSQMVQQPIISMEDDEISDQEISQLEDHGHFKSLAKLWEHLPHLAVFTNYILSNSDPNSLLFYLLTDLYKEGNAREMRKWAFEIHSSFLVPGAPLHLGNVGEDVATEIDEVLLRDFNKEEILRKIFWKARVRAKEELSRQLVEFQQKRTAGLGTIYGPTDQELAEIYNDKVREARLYEFLFLSKLDPYLEELDKENVDTKRYYTAAALTTVMTRIFQISPKGLLLEKCPTFVSKEKSFRTKLIARYSKKLTVLGHQFIAQPYYSVTSCNNCHQIIYGISPQGYQCSACLINLHRTCVKLYDDSCPGPIKSKDSRIRKFIRMSHDSADHNRIKKTSNFLQMEKERRQLEESRDSSFELNESADSSRPGQPVSRSGSDRRPDSVKEEGGRCEGTAAPSAASDGALDGDAVKETAATDSSVSLPASGNRRKVGSNINRSESWKESSEKRKQKRNISDPSHNASGDVDLEKQGLTNTDSGSSSHSSLSCNGRLSESPSSNSVVGEPLARVKSLSDTETDLDDGEADPLNWQERVPEEELKKLDQQELKRQDVINELFSTEASHVRNLKVLYKVFYKRLSQSSTLKPDELALIFPNLKDVLDLHAAASDDMRRKRRDDPIVRELGELLVRMFCGPQGEELKRASALFCERQRLALELITRRRERDSKFDAALAECEKKRQCRRLPLQGILPTQMQRLSKYPLLLERLIGVAAAAGAAAVDEEELRRLRKAHDASKEILHFVNEAAKVAMNKHRLEDIQKRLDTSAFERADHEIVREFKSLDLTRYKLVLEGNMQLRRPNKGVVPVHVLLLEEMVVILHREGDRFTLKFFQSGTPAAPQPLSPIIKMNSLLVRINAVSKDALFLVNTATSNCQMYDLIAESESKREEWFRNFSDAGDVYNRREGGKPSRHKQPSAAGGAAGGAAAPGRAPTPPADEPAAGGGGGEEETVRDLPADSESEPGRAEPAVEGEGPARDAAEPEGADAAEGRSREEGMVVRGDGDAVGVQTRVTAEDWPLVQPSQIVVSAPPVLTAERILTPLEQIRRKDLEVREALAAKEGLVADLLSIPREHYHTIADMAGDNALMAPKDLAERVMASMFQVDLLQKAVNDALNITESDSIEAKGGKPVCASQEAPEKPKIPSVPATVVKDIAASLSLQLITLLNDVKQVEEERDRLRREVDRFREQIHEQYHLHDGVSQEDEPPDDTEADVEAAGAAENADEAEAPAKGCDKEEVFYETSSDNQ